MIIDYILISFALLLISLSALFIHNGYKERKLNSLKKRNAEYNALVISIVAFFILVGYWLRLKYDAGVDLIISIVATSQAFGAILIKYGREKILPSNRKIAFIGKSNSNFSQLIFQGFFDELKDHDKLTVKEIKPRFENEENITFQLEALRSKDVQDCDALVIVPVESNDLVNKELVKLTQKGKFIVLIDNKIPNQLFYEHGLRMPCFITSDFAHGGRCIAELIVSKMDVKNDLCIAMIGPKYSAPASIRSHAILHELFAQLKMLPLFVSELKSWDASAAFESFEHLVFSASERGIIKNKGKIFVFCGNDKMAVAFSKFIRKDKRLRELDFFLIGYDGIKDREDNLVIAEQGFSCATVDVRPHSQGSLAAKLIIETYDRNTSANKNTKVIPKLLYFP